MTDIPKVSIIIPAYNEATALKRCLDAPLRAKQERDWEVIVVDDGSTDATGETAQTRGADLVRLTPNRGVAAARNAGARKAQGHILVFVDADIIVPVETLYALIDRLHQDAAVHAVGACPAGNLNPQWSSRFLDLQVQWYVKRHVKRDENVSCFPSECGAVRREIFEAAGGFPETHGGVGMEEFALGHIIERQGRRNVLLPDAPYYTYYESFGRRCIEVLHRTARWAPLFLRRRRLEPVFGSGTPIGEAASCFLVLVILVGMIGGIALPAVWWIAAGAALMHFLIQCPWVYYVFRSPHGGLLTALLAWPALVVTHFFIITGFAWGALHYLLRLSQQPKDDDDNVSTTT